jgi:hypothetical protein
MTTTTVDKVGGPLFPSHDDDDDDVVVVCLLRVLPVSLLQYNCLV